MRNRVVRHFGRFVSVFGAFLDVLGVFCEAGPKRTLRSLTPQETQTLLQRSATRVKAFATAQRGTLDNCISTIPGGNAGHNVVPLSSAGCYAPGGRYPLPSSVLMTVIPARLTGCASVVVCSFPLSSHFGGCTCG